MTQAHIIDLTPQSGAGVDVATPRVQLVAAIRAAFGRLYAPGALAPGHGHNLILYHGGSATDVRMTVGVLDRAPGGGDPEIRPAQAPGGRVITATHWGDYSQMKTTYDALHAEVKARGLKVAPLSLEIYGDWFDDPAKVRTDLYLYLGTGI